MADFSFPKLSIDPSKIKDRWGLGALGLVVWLVVAYGVLMRPDFNLVMAICILFLTFSLMVLVLMLSFSRAQEAAVPQGQSPNVPPAGNVDTKNPKLAVQQIIYVAELYEFWKNPGVQDAVDKKFGKGRK